MVYKKDTAFVLLKVIHSGNKQLDFAVVEAVQKINYFPKIGFIFHILE
jgi:hypothetical protein